MAPKKQKMSLNDFLADETLGSWADEMESLPTAPAFRSDDASRNRGGDRGYGDRPDRGFSSDRGDRPQFPPREDVPLPTEPPFTAFIGNLPFDLTEAEIEEHFGPHKVKTVKIISDKKDGKPKGFGYVEFEELAGLKDAMAKSGSSLAGRVIRVSVADPPKERERSGFGGGGGFDDEKYSGDWRRTGPLPALEERRGSRPGSSREEGGGGFGFGSRFHDREPGPPSVAESAGDWRSNKPSPRLGTNLIPDPSTMKRRSSGFSTPTDGPSPADTEEVWTMGSKFKRSPPASVAGGGPGAGPPGPGRKFSAGRGDMGPPPAPSAADEGDWRSGPRRPGNAFERSPTNSTPPTPNMGRKKLELLPRSGGGSAVGSPMSSPKFASATPVAARANPFGAAKPIDASAREKEVMERKEKDNAIRRVPSSRPSSRAPSERAHSPPPGPQTPSSPAPSGARFTAAANVRPAVSFASAAKAKAEGEAAKAKGDGVEDIASGVKEITV